MQVAEVSGSQMLIGLGIGLAVLIFLILKTKVHVIVALIIAAVIVGIVGGLGTTAPIVEAAGGNMLLGAFAVCIGALFFSYFNDSFYWVVNRLSGITETKEQIRVWSVTTTIVWSVGLVELLIYIIFM